MQALWSSPVAVPFTAAKYGDIAAWDIHTFITLYPSVYLKEATEQSRLRGRGCEVIERGMVVTKKMFRMATTKTKLVK